MGVHAGTLCASFHGQPATLIIVKKDPFVPDLLPQNLVLGNQVRDGSLLLTVGPPGQADEKELPRLGDEAHGSPQMFFPKTLQQRSSSPDSPLSSR
ncbi:hypothetical protein ACFLU6_02960 [Acidobacteriota bacterium]